jgi:hypothetical protein
MCRGRLGLTEMEGVQPFAHLELADALIDLGHVDAMPQGMAGAWVEIHLVPEKIKIYPYQLGPADHKSLFGRRGRFRGRSTATRAACGATFSSGSARHAHDRRARHHIALAPAVLAGEGRCSPGLRTALCLDVLEEVTFGWDMATSVP